MSDPMAWLPAHQEPARLRAAGDQTVRLEVRAELTIGTDALVAALYACFPLPPAALDDPAAADLAAAELAAAELAAAELVLTGLDELYRRADQVTAAEAGTVPNPEWLATCRQYVTSLHRRQHAGSGPRKDSKQDGTIRGVTGQ
jgi:hypothetical protein